MTIVAWDFDGVLNRNIAEGDFVWHLGFEADIGRSVASFVDHVFGEDFIDVITGREDLRDRVDGWVAKVSCPVDADAILAYWFARDALPDPDMLRLMDRLAENGVRQVIATNNEARRARYIERDMGFGARVERVFASGRMGVAKPDPGFFGIVTSSLGVRHSDMLLIDDHERNVDAATALGWTAILFTPATAQDLADRLPL